MIITYSPPESCTLYDLVLNIYTSLDMMEKFIADNKLETLDIVTSVGDKFFYDTDYIYDYFMFDTITNETMVFCTGKGTAQIIENFILTEEPDILSTETDNYFIT